MRYEFAERLEFSQGQNVETDKELIKQILPNCERVEKTDIETDKSGIDYRAYLTGGGQVGIDVKMREKGASRFWRNGDEELALEIWSVCPTKDKAGKRGWTLLDSTNVDYILYKFDKQDSRKVYFLPYQLLRKTFLENGLRWVNKYGRKRQASENWTSEAVFVPAREVLNGIKSEMEIQS